MPHLVVKLYTGRSESQKQQLAEALSRTLIETLGSKESSISVAIEDVSPDEWTQRVYEPDILGKPETIYKQPGY